MSNSSNPNMNIVVDSTRQYKSNLNSDNYRDLFKVNTYVEYENSTIKPTNIVFLDFNNEFLDINRAFILSQCIIKEFQPRWTYRPNYLSYDMYGSQLFSYLLMYINDISSVLDFKFDYVKVPTTGCIKDLAISNQRLYSDRNTIKDIKFA